MNQPRRLSYSLVSVLWLVTSLQACGHSAPDYPLFAEGRPLGSFSGLKGSAPPVTGQVTFERILRARNEP